MAEENKKENDKMEIEKSAVGAKEQNFPKWISEGLLIAAVPALIYYISFGYELGYFFYFGISSSIATANFSSIFSTIFVIAFLFIVFFLFYSYIITLNIVPFQRNKKFPNIKMLILFIAIIISIIISRITKIEFIEHIALALSFIIGFGLIIYLMDFKSIIGDKYTFKMVAWIVAIFLLAHSFFEFSQAIGLYMARFNKNYYIYEVHPEMIALRIYSDRIICAKFDRENKTIDSTFVIIDISSSSPVRLHKEEIGPLKPIKKFLEEKKKDKTVE